VSCVLRISSENVDLEALLRNSSLRILTFSRKGEVSPGRSAPSPCSACNIDVSDAEVGDLQRQVSDALIFLGEHATELRNILSSKDGVHAVLDFSVSQRDVSVQNSPFPAKLLHIMGDLGIELNVSIYFRV
jgi:hypothetical protein